MQQSIDPAMRSPLRWAIAGYLLLFMTLSLMRMRNLIFTDGKTPPWVSELILRAPVSPAFSSWAIFAMGGYAFFVWLAVAMTVAPLALLALHTVLQRRAILRGVAQRRGARGADACRTGATGGRGVNLRRKAGYGWSARCWRAWG